MERKTKVNAEEGKQYLTIAREFDLPVELLFKAYTEAEFLAQWMGTKVVKLDNRKHGSWQFETSDPAGNVVFKANGVIHDVVPEKSLIRTFEMEGEPYGVQLELYSFKAITDEISMLNVRIVFESAEHRDQMLKLPFVYGINMAHERLQDVLSRHK